MIEGHIILYEAIFNLDFKSKGDSFKSDGQFPHEILPPGVNLQRQMWNSGLFPYTSSTLKVQSQQLAM